MAALNLQGLGLRSNFRWPGVEDALRGQGKRSQVFRALRVTKRLWEGPQRYMSKSRDFSKETSYAVPIPWSDGVIWISEPYFTMPSPYRYCHSVMKSQWITSVDRHVPVTGRSCAWPSCSMKIARYQNASTRQGCSRKESKVLSENSSLCSQGTSIILQLGERTFSDKGADDVVRRDCPSSFMCQHLFSTSAVSIEISHSTRNNSQKRINLSIIHLNINKPQPQWSKQVRQTDFQNRFHHVGLRTFEQVT